MEQTKHTVVLSGATALRALRRERLGVLVENEQVDLAVGRIAKRTATPPVIAHCIGNLGEGGLMRIAKELYALSPAALTLDLARDSSFEGLLALMEELSSTLPSDASQSARQLLP